MWWWIVSEVCIDAGSFWMTPADGPTVLESFCPSRDAVKLLRC